MKQYLIPLKSSNFTKNGNTWLSDPVNLYSNSFYKNYSYYRSSTGLDLIGDRTFVGTEIASPNIENEAEAITAGAVYVTNFGEVVRDSATPSILRFIDTSSQIDLLGYRYKFTNLVGDTDPSFLIKIHESESSNGPWLTNFASGEISTLFIQNVKPYIQIELEINDDEADLNSIGLIFYLEVGIHNPVSPVATSSAKNILRRFPTWTALYADSVGSATPSLDVPQSEGGKFLTALVQDNLQNFQRTIELEQINSYINSADISMLAWMYVSYNIPANLQTITGDQVQLTNVSSFNDLKNLRQTDYAYYYNKVSKALYTLRKFENLYINEIKYEQTAINVFNDFDEFGVRVGLPRLYLESNDSFKKRILDVTSNIPGTYLEGFKRTLRRELDIWRAYGATPDSDYAGATPEVLEISDIESTTPYFTASGKPEKLFKDFVSSLNKKYPSNYGYVRWDEGIWDYAGLLGEGVSRIPAVYDVGASPLHELYHPGVGDFDDAKFLLDQDAPVFIDDTSSEIATFSGYLKLTGLSNDNNVIEEAYTPIVVRYDVFGTYTQNIPSDPPYGMAFLYEIDLHPHDNYENETTFYANISYLDYEELYVKNMFPKNSSAYPESILFPVFNADGLVIDTVEFKNKFNDEKYLNTVSTPNSDRISIYDASAVRVARDVEWNYNLQDYQVYGGNISSSLDGDVYFNVNDPQEQSTISYMALDFFLNTVEMPGYELTSPNIGYHNSSARLHSEYFEYESATYSTDIVSGYVTINTLNDQSATSNFTTTKDEITRGIIFPFDATPQSYIINVINDGNNPLADQGVPGGYTTHPMTDDIIFVPSSPNLIYNENATVNGSYVSQSSYFDSATLSYGIDYTLNVGSASSEVYPVKYNPILPFELTTTPNFYSGYLDIYGNAYEENELAENAFYNEDRFIATYSISAESFGLDSESIYVLDKISIINNKPSINVYTDNIERMVEDFSLAIAEEDSVSFNLYAEELYDYKASLNIGWIYFDENDYYLYSAPYVQELDSVTVPESKFKFNGSLSDISVQQDGKLIFGGLFTQFDSTSSSNIIRLNSDYTVDSAFISNIGDGANDEVKVCIARASGRIFIGGSFTSWDSIVSGRFIVLNSDGTLDTDFMLNAGSGANGDINSIVFQSNGKIIIAGSFTNWNGNSVGNVVRLNSDGTLDLSFLTNIGVGVNSEVLSIALDSLDNIILTGSFTSWNSVTAGRIVKLNSDGTLNTPFSINTGAAANDSVRYAAVQEDDSILFAGTFNQWDGNNLTSIVRVSSSGLLDNTFSLNIGTGPFGDIDHILVYEGAIFISGQFTSWDGITVGRLVKTDLSGNINSFFTINSGSGADDKVSKAYILNADSVIIIGSFTSWNGVSVGRAVELDLSGYNSGIFPIEIDLDHTPNLEAPIIVKSDDNEYRYLVFESSSTPGYSSFVNEEIVKSNSSNYLFLSYENVRNISVVDSFNGKLIANALNTLSNEISVFNEYTEKVINREYIVRYTVNNSFYIESDIYDESTDQYVSKIYFSSLPDVTKNYEITYEKSFISNKSFIDLEIDQYANPIKEGYVYVSNSDYDFKEIEYNLSPRYILDDRDEIMDLSIISYDINGNLKPGQTFEVYGSNVSATPRFITTNDNGLGITRVRYEGSIPTSTPNDFFNIVGIGSATPNGAENSSSQGYYEIVPFEVVRQNNFGLKIKAVPLRYTVQNGETSINIIGKIYWNNELILSPVSLSWYFGTSLKEVFESTNANQILSREDGTFNINLDLSSELSNLDPGIRFIRIEISDGFNINNTLQSLGKVISESDITIAGELIYWNEDYDNVHFANEDLPLPEFFNRVIDDTEDFFGTSAFLYGHTDYDVVSYSGATPDWVPARWFPIDRYNQYQMGILGSTPNTITEYDDMHPDYEDS